MNFVSQVHDTGDNNSINICKICFLREWYAYGRTMGKKGCLHLLLGTHPRLASFVYVPVLLSCDFHVSKTCHFCLLKMLCCIWYSRVAHGHSHTLLQLRYIHFCLMKLYIRCQVTHPMLQLDSTYINIII